MTTKSSERMISRLLAQFDEKPVVYAVLETLGEELDRLDFVRKQLNEEIYPLTAVGKQLDICGEVAALDRNLPFAIEVPFFGFPSHGDKTFGTARFRRYGEQYESSSRLKDDEFRTLLLGKIAKNNTSGSRKSTIECMKKTFNTDVVVARNEGNASVSLYINADIPQYILDIADEYNLFVLDAGVGIKEVHSFKNVKGTFGFSINGVPQEGVVGFTIKGFIIEN